LLAQVSGRAGRGETPGEVFVQTYTPNHPAVKAAVRADFVTFAGYELAERKEAAFPPYTRLACINLRCADEEKLIFTSNNFAKELAKHIAPGVHCSEAMPAPLARAKGVYRYQILLRARQAQAINKTIRAALQEIRLPSEVGWSIDMDALSLM
jgi:primosomal protein N' (replication factor Y)